MFSYFGSKAQLAHTYQAPQYQAIIEPFAGAAGYSMFWLQKMPTLAAYLSDADHLVIDMWDRLLSMDPEELWSYPPPEVGTRSTDLVYLAVTVSSGSWNRCSSGGDFAVTPWMARDFFHRREVMAQTLASVKGRVHVAEGDYRDAPDMEATWFIDPPYQLDGQWYALGNKIDFSALGEWCRTRSGQTIVCESGGADWMDFRPHVTNRTVSNTQSAEVVWYSHPEPDLLSLMEAAET